MAPQLLDMGLITIFAREFLEGSLIVAQYRTVVLMADESAFSEDFTRKQALREVSCSAMAAVGVSVIMMAIIAIPLAVLSTTFSDKAVEIIEGTSKLIAAIAIILLSLKLPSLLGIYGKPPKEKTLKGRIGMCCASMKQRGSSQKEMVMEGSPDDSHIVEFEQDSKKPEGLTRRSIRFNVAWNLWREASECGIFVLPFFLTGKNIVAVPLSAVLGAAIGILFGVCIYIVNRRYQKRRLAVAIFAVLLFVFLSVGLFVGGCHEFEEVLGETRDVWWVSNQFWSSGKLPMSLLAPFGYSSSRTVLQMCSFWLWLALAALLHYRMYRISPKPAPTPSNDDAALSNGKEEDVETAELGEASIESKSEDGAPSGKIDNESEASA